MALHPIQRVRLEPVLDLMSTRGRSRFQGLVAVTIVAFILPSTCSIKPVREGLYSVKAGKHASRQSAQHSFLGQSQAVIRQAKEEAYSHVESVDKV